MLALFFYVMSKHALLARIAILQRKEAPHPGGRHPCLGHPGPLRICALPEVARLRGGGGGDRSGSEVPLAPEAAGARAEPSRAPAAVRGRFGADAHLARLSLPRRAGPQDRGILVQLHPAEGALAERYNAVANLKGCSGATPGRRSTTIPAEGGCGLVLIDPPGAASQRLGRELVAAA